MTRHVIPIAACALFLTFSPPAWSQTVTDTTGAVIGKVIDQTAAILVGVTVTASGGALMGTLSSVTDAGGMYRFPALPPAEYTLQFSRQGFQTIRREAVPVPLGATVTVDVIMSIVDIASSVTVNSPTPILDRRSTSLVVDFDAAQLRNLPGVRSMGALLSATPAVQMARFDVGGSAGVLTPNFSAYGTSGGTRPMVEGIVISQINSFSLTLDYGSFHEVALTSAAQGPESGSPGLQLQFVVKSGGNEYHASVYADDEDRHLQSFNIDRRQIDRVGASGGALSRDANRLWSYNDVNADAGGYIRKDRLWWYGSARRQQVSAQLITFPVKPYRTELGNFTVKGTYRLSSRQQIVVFANGARDDQPNQLDGFGPAGGTLTATTAINNSEESTSKLSSSGSIAKAEWNWTPGNSFFLEVRAGRFAARREEVPNGHAPRFENVSSSVVSGGNRDWEATLHRPQLLASATYIKRGRFGSHQAKLGSELFRLTETQSWRHAYSGSVLHVVKNNELGVPEPSEVYLFRAPSRSESGLWWSSAYVNDAWQMGANLSVNLGLRVDHFRVFLPEQSDPATAQTFAGRNLIDWTMASPRVGLVYDLFHDGKTIAKVSGGRYAFVPGTDLGFNANPNSNQPWDRYRWIDDNGDGSWQPGEQKQLLATRGLESIDPALKLPQTREMVLAIARELPGRVALQSNVVWRSVRDPYTRLDDTRPFSAYTVATSIQDPGPDGKVGTADDGPDITAYDLPSSLSQTPSVNVVQNVAGATSDYWTWEITAAKRSTGRWSLIAGFANTWNRDYANGYAGQPIRRNVYPLTPNDLINTDDDGRHDFTVWSVKLSGTYELPWGVRATPFLRHQSGQPFARTLAVSVGGTNRILAEPIGTRRMDDLTLVDVRVEKVFHSVAHAQVSAFIDIFNLLNANPEQNISWVSGSRFLEPLSIVPPRIGRVGIRLDW